MSQNNEWYTPSKYIEVARQVMGSIDLDPASCEVANQTVKAAKYYTEKDNGLTLPWHGNIWLNPPFGRYSAAEHTQGGGKSRMVIFINKLIREYKAGHIQQAVLLTMPKTDTQWFRPLWNYSICFAHHRVLFNRPSGLEAGQMFGTIFVYLGENDTRFVELFSKFGPVVPRGSVVLCEKPIEAELWAS